MKSKRTRIIIAASAATLLVAGLITFFVLKNKHKLATYEVSFALPETASAEERSTTKLPEAVKVQEGTTIGTLAKPTRDGAIFMNWTYDPQGLNRANSDDPITSDLVLFPRFVKEQGLNDITGFTYVSKMNVPADFDMELITYGLSREQVAAAYGYGFGPGDAFWKTRAAPPSGEIRFGMTYTEVEDLVSGNTAESSYARHIGTGCCNSLCGGLCDVGFIFNAGSGALDVITIRFPEGGDDAATWFELYSRFTELFGAPDEAAQTRGFTTPDELRTLLSETDAVPTVAWSRGAERLVLKPDLFARGRRQVSVTISRP